MTLIKSLGLGLLACSAAWAVCAPRTGFSEVATVRLPSPSDTLTNFVLPLHTSGSSLAPLETDLAATARSDGFDVVFDIDGGGAIKHCRVEYDSATGFYWAYLRLTISAETDICVSFGDADATDTSDCTASTGAWQDAEIVIAGGGTADLAGNSHTATATNTPTTEAGVVGTAWSFAAASAQYLDLAATGSGGELQNRTWSISAVVRGDLSSAVAVDDRVINRITSSGTRYPEWNWDGARANAPGASGGNCTFGSLSASTWYVLTQVYDSLTLQRTYCYQGGTLNEDKSTSVAVPTPTSNIRVGGHPSSGASWSGEVNHFSMRLDTAENSAAWQSYWTAAWLTPDDVMTLVDDTIALVPALPILRFRYAPIPTPMFLAAPATTCAAGETQIGIACTSFGADIDMVEGGIDR